MARSAVRSPASPGGERSPHSSRVEVAAVDKPRPRVALCSRGGNLMLDHSVELPPGRSRLVEYALSLGSGTGIIVALVQVLKHSSLGNVVPKQDWGLIAIALGIGWTILVAQVPDNDLGNAPFAAWVVLGVVAGLAASGAYDTTRGQVERHSHRGDAADASDTGGTGGAERG
jgi:hypothetical protein